MKMRLIVIISVSISMWACNPKQKDEKNAMDLLEQVKNEISQKNHSNARQLIDSLHATYPTMVAIRKQAAAQLDTMLLRESHKTVAFGNEYLPRMKSEIERLKQNFRFEINKKYESIGKYVYKTQHNEQNTAFTHLKVTVDEHGNLYLSSFYRGVKLNHHDIELQAGSLTTATNNKQTKNAVFHSFKDGDTTVEILTFKNEADNNLSDFIRANKNSVIRVKLMADKNTTYTLSESNKKAISSAVELSKAIKLYRQTEREFIQAQERIGKIKLLYQ